MALLFRHTRILENQIDGFLDAISEGCIVFRLGVHDYLSGSEESFQQRIESIGSYENKADALRRDIEQRLYGESLIPEHRGDVLGLLENLDDVIDVAKDTLKQFDVERPVIPAEWGEAYAQLAVTSVEAAEALVHASRAFFREATAVQNHLHKVHFFEKEADRISEALKRRIFGSQLDLASKIHLRYFALHIENISDRAQSVADRLAIYTIKRTI